MSLCYPLDAKSIISSKKTLLIGGVVVGGAIAAGFFYHYFFVLTLPKAEQLCHEITEYVKYVTSHYQRELTLLEKSNDYEEQKAELQKIIAEFNSESPFLTYTNTIKRDLSKCEVYEKQFSRGIPQLKKTMDKLIEKEKIEVIEEKQEELQGEINRYKAVLSSIAQLSEMLHALRYKLQRLVNYCVQYDAYKQEMILDRLQAIETQLILNRMSNSR